MGFWKRNEKASEMSKKEKHERGERFYFGVDGPVPV